MQPFNFGEAAVQGYQSGLQITQKADQFQKTLEQSEETAKASQAIEALKMEVLNKQLKQADNKLEFEKKAEYDKNLRDIQATSEKNWIKVDPRNPYVMRLGPKALVTHKDLFNTSGAIRPEGDYLPDDLMKQIQGEMLLDKQLEHDTILMKSAILFGQEKDRLKNLPTITANAIGEALNAIKDPAIISTTVNKREPTASGWMGTLGNMVEDIYAPVKTSMLGDRFTGLGKRTLGSDTDKFTRENSVVAEPASLKQALDETARLYGTASTILGQFPENAKELNTNVNLVGTRSKMWELMQRAQSQGIDDNGLQPFTKAVMNQLNSQYSSLLTKYEMKTENMKQIERGKFRKDSEKEALQKSLDAIDASRGGRDHLEQFNNLFSGQAFDPSLAIRQGSFADQF